MKMIDADKYLYGECINSWFLVNELDEEIKRDSKTPSQAVYCSCSSAANLTPKEYNKMFIKRE